ncbi:hypothetical protein TWF730_008473 [Orbilia blumenaviensis]|uniref:Major facilitator superfamily (MFS) profile domain-containing protein n=1 Tax=Orbilia blumenaviensis TaxID=1796055 RepID=A0AAV9V4T2_9PEZI
MIRSFGVAEDNIGFWAGVISASLALCQFLTGVVWGRLSDKIGRKPSILIGLAMMAASTIAFGFSTSIPMAIVSRCCIGLTGNIGILRTVVAELVPDPDLKLQALGLLPLAWNIGTISGPALGGFLSEPARKYPGLFPSDSFFDRNPWALPNILLGAMIFIGCLLAFLFLDETLEGRRMKYDSGREVGKKIELLIGLNLSKCEVPSRNACTNDIENHPKQVVGGYVATYADTPPSWSEVLTPQSKYLVILMFFAALHRVTAEQLFSLFFATSVHSTENPTKLPFHLPGGYGFNSSQLGAIFVALGLVEILTQIFVYAPMARRYGNLALLSVAALTDPILYFFVPYTLALYDKRAGLEANWICYTAVTVILFLFSVNSVLGLNSIVILVTDSASSPRVLATLNGFATSITAFGIAIGPSTFGLLYSIGQKSRWTTIPWVGLTIVASAMWIWIPKVKSRK